jgi:hypothetical protein
LRPVYVIRFPARAALCSLPGVALLLPWPHALSSFNLNDHTNEHRSPTHPILTHPRLLSPWAHTSFPNCLFRHAPPRELLLAQLKSEDIASEVSKTCFTVSCTLLLTLHSHYGVSYPRRPRISLLLSAYAHPVLLLGSLFLLQANEAIGF